MEARSLLLIRGLFVCGAIGLLCAVTVVSLDSFVGLRFPLAVTVTLILFCGVALQIYLRRLLAVKVISEVGETEPSPRNAAFWRYAPGLRQPIIHSIVTTADEFEPRASVNL